MRIGIFDSGIGGLTVLSAVAHALPGHDLLYLGDTARIPYGTRSPSTVLSYSLRVASYLYQQQVDAMVVACNTASTYALSALQEAGHKEGIPIFGVIEPGVVTALDAHQSGAIALLGTDGTVEGGAYQTALHRLAPTVRLHAVACPLFVPLVEEGWLSGEVPRQIAEHYLGHLRNQTDTVILGCTHYPLLASVIREVLPNVTLVDSATSTAAALLAALGPGTKQDRTISYRVTDNVERFHRVGSRFLGHPPNPVEWVDLGAGVHPFSHEPTPQEPHNPRPADEIS